MATLEKHVKRAASKNLMANAMKDTQTEGMKSQMDYSANSTKKQDNSPMKKGPSGATCGKMK